jgi:D-arabinose 1-dehydrogenase-like Zn-dependent alcohol dehydrogenase
VKTDWPSHTRAALLHAYGEPLSVEEIPLPDRLEPGSAIVRVAGSTLCGSDVHVWEGKLATRKVPLPVVLGHEVVGRVVAIDPADTRDVLGRTIGIGELIGWGEASCGHCHACTVLGTPTQCAARRYGILESAREFPYALGGLSEYTYVPPGSSRMLIPEALPTTWAAAAGCSLKTVIRGFRRAGGVQPGQSVVIQGSGALGLFGTALAVVSGADPVVTVGGPAARLEVAKAFRATATIDLDELPEPEARVEAVRELTGGRGADLVCDFAGGRTSTAEAVEMCARHGRHLVVGQVAPTDVPIGAHLVMTRELTIVGTSSGDVGDHYRALRFLERHAATFEWDRIFTPPYPLSQVHFAMEAMASLSVVKAVVDTTR